MGDFCCTDIVIGQQNKPVIVVTVLYQNVNELVYFAGMHEGHKRVG